MAAGHGQLGVGIEISALSAEEREEMKHQMAGTGEDARRGRARQGGGRQAGGRSGNKGAGAVPMSGMEGEELWMTVNLAK